ncbi:Crp/Fnr family transcriptional regulator [Pelobium manganitolerans]|uniref:Crp/Fnr family transcriptional regulator n=1 Tax=Pelobium manganitolerans TaxID=1842495 RepID=UPI003FA3D03D
MNTFTLKSYLTSNLGINEVDLNELTKNFKSKSVKKDEFLLRANEYCKQSFFVESGLLRQFSVDSKGKEHIISFAPENWFVTDRESSYFNQPSVYYIQALEASRVVLLDENQLQTIGGSIPSFAEFNNKLLHNHIRVLQSRISSLLSDTAEERYLKFIKTYPDVTLRVPQTMVASYLGITPESLSRLRRDLALRKTR